MEDLMENSSGLVCFMMNWLLIPGGYRGEGGFMMSLKHFFRGIHEWTALLFIIVVVIHFMLHWPYITSNLKKHGLLINRNDK
jgi:hypothetical protein